jgi:hypothetical protein
MSQEVWPFRDRIETVIKDVAAENEILFTEEGLMELNELMQPKVHEIIWVLLGVKPEEVDVKLSIYKTPSDEPSYSWKTDISIKTGSPRPGCQGCRNCSKGTR